MGSVMQNLLPKNFAVIRCLVFWSVGRLCGGCFAIFGGWIFVLCPELLLMGRVKEDLLPENFAVIRCLVFCLFVVCAAVVLRYLVVRFLSWFWSCSLLVLSVRFGSLSRAFPLRLSSFLFFSLLRVFLFWGVGRGGGLFPCSASPLGLLRSRCRRCRQELAHDCTPSLPLFSFLPSFPLSPSSRPASSPSRRLFFSLFVLSSFFFLPFSSSVVLSLSVCLFWSFSLSLSLSLS